MIKFNRRKFMQASTASLLLDTVKDSASPGSGAKIDDTATAFVHTNAEGKSWIVGNTRQGEGIIALFKNESQVEQVPIELPAFPDGTFRLRSVMTGQVLGTRSGEQFRHGIQIRLPPEHNVEVLEIRR